MVAVGSDQLCADQLLINEWKQLGGVSLSANQGVTTPFLWRLKASSTRSKTILFPPSSFVSRVFVMEPL